MSEHIWEGSEKPAVDERNIKMLSPQREYVPGHARRPTAPLTCSQSSNNSLLRDKLRIIKKHTLKMALEHPHETSIIAEELAEIVGLLSSSHQFEADKRQNPFLTKGTAVQTNEGYLPPFYQEISIIQTSPNSGFSNKTTPEYLRAREAIYKDICVDNEALIRQNLRIAEQNAELTEAIESLASRYAEVTQKYTELQRTIEKLHEVGSIYNSNSKVLLDAAAEETDQRFLFSPRSSNLSNRKSCLSSFKNTVCSVNFFDQMSNTGGRKMGSLQPTLTKPHQTQFGQQTEPENLCANARDLKQQLIFYDRTLSRLAADNAAKDRLLGKISEIVTQYLERDPGELSLSNITNILEQVYNKRSLKLPLVRKSTIYSQGLEDHSELHVCKSEDKLTVIRENFQKKIIRRKC